MSHRTNVRSDFDNGNTSFVGGVSRYRTRSIRLQRSMAPPETKTAGIVVKRGRLTFLIKLSSQNTCDLWDLKEARRNTHIYCPS